MPPKKKTFLEELADHFALMHAIEASKDTNGKPDPYKAAGIAWGMKGNLSWGDIANLGAMLGTQGAFDDEQEMTEDDELFSVKEPPITFKEQEAEEEVPYATGTEPEKEESWKEHLTLDQRGEALRHGIDVDEYEDEAEFLSALEYGRLRYMRYDKPASELSTGELVILQARAMGIEPDDFTTFEALKAEVDGYLGWYGLDMRRMLFAYELKSEYKDLETLIQRAADLRIPPPEEFDSIQAFMEAVENEIQLVQKINEVVKKHPELRNVANELAEIKYEYGHAFASEEDRQAAIQRLLDILFPLKRTSPRKKAMERKKK